MPESRAMEFPGEAAAGSGPRFEMRMAKGWDKKEANEKKKKNKNCRWGTEEGSIIVKLFLILYHLSRFFLDSCMLYVFLSGYRGWWPSWVYDKHGSIIHCICSVQYAITEITEFAWVSEGVHSLYFKTQRSATKDRTEIPEYRHPRLQTARRYVFEETRSGEGSNK